MAVSCSWRGTQELSILLDFENITTSHRNVCMQQLYVVFHQPKPDASPLLRVNPSLLLVFFCFSFSLSSVLLYFHRVLFSPFLWSSLKGALYFSSLLPSFVSFFYLLLPPSLRSPLLPLCLSSFINRGTSPNGTHLPFFVPPNNALRHTLHPPSFDYFASLFRKFFCPLLFFF